MVIIIIKKKFIFSLFYFKVFDLILYYILQGGLIANMIMAIVILRRKYTVTKYVSVLMITLGTIICTFASAENIVR